MEPADWALLMAFSAAAVLGTLVQCLLVNDGALFIATGWLGNSWTLYFGQFADRALGAYFSFGPAQVVLHVFPMSAGAFVTLSHILYFLVPLALWLVLRRIEPRRFFSRLYLASVLALLFFPTELIVGNGFWLIWLAIATDARRSVHQVIGATAVVGAVLIFTHPAFAMVSLVYLAAGFGLRRLGKPVSRRSLFAAAALSAVLVLGYLVVTRALPPTNPSTAAALSASSQMYFDVPWLAASVGRFPATAALWLLLVIPALLGRLRPRYLAPLAIIGLWFAAAGTNLLTYLLARYTAPYVLTLAIALAMAAPDAWLKGAQKAFVLYAAIAATAAVSYTADLFLFGRFVDERLRPGIVNVEAVSGFWPTPFRPYRQNSPTDVGFKWGAGSDYVRDVVVPTYDWHRVTLAFYGFFRSDRRSVLFHPLTASEWVPFEREGLQRAKTEARDDADRMLLDFIGTHYCANCTPGR